MRRKIHFEFSGGNATNSIKKIITLISYESQGNKKEKTLPFLFKTRYGYTALFTIIFLGHKYLSLFFFMKVHFNVGFCNNMVIFVKIETIAH